MDDHNARYTGSGALASAMGMNRSLTKNIFKIHNIKTPYHIILENSDEAAVARHVMTIFKSFPMPAVVKPASAGAGQGVTLVKDFFSIEPALRNAFLYDNTVVVEEYIKGRSASVGVVEGFRGEELYTLPVVEIHDNGDIFVPGNYSAEEKAELARLAQEAHRALGLRHYSHTDFVVSPRRGIYVLEVSSQPDLADAALMPQALSSVGASLPDFLDHLITLANE